MIGPSIIIATWNHSEAPHGMLLDRLPTAACLLWRGYPTLDWSDQGNHQTPFLMLFAHTGHVNCQISTTSWDMTFPQPVPHRILNSVASGGGVVYEASSYTINWVRGSQLAKLQKSHIPTTSVPSSSKLPSLTPQLGLSRILAYNPMCSICVFVHHTCMLLSWSSFVDEFW